MISAVSFLDKTFAGGRKFLGTFFVFVFFLSLGIRMLFSALFKGAFPKLALILGCSESGRLLIEQFHKSRNKGDRLGIDIIGYVCNERISSEISYDDLPCLGDYNALKQIIESNWINLLILASDEKVDDSVNELIVEKKLQGVDLISALGLYSAVTGKIPYEYFDSSKLIESCLRTNRFATLKFKRLFDFISASILALGTLPIVLISALIIKLESKGPAIFTQKRIGIRGKPFKIYKLRTMTVNNKKDRDAQKDLYLKDQARITTFGRFLRKFHVDELPQFFNILRGDMSLVGPRPEMQVYIKQCQGKINFYKLRLAIKPGLTGWAQVWFRHTSTLKTYKTKFQYDLYYLSEMSMMLDLEILIRTIFYLLGYRKTQSGR